MNNVINELLNETLFSSLAQAKAALADWRNDYNTLRTPGSVGTHRPSSPKPSLPVGLWRFAK